MFLDHSHAQFRRAAPQPRPTIRHPQPFKVKWPDDIAEALGGVQITGHRREILIALCMRRGRPVTLDQIIESMWDDEYTEPLGADGVIKVVMVQIRKLLPGKIETLRGIGYRLLEDMTPYQRIIDELGDSPDPAVRQMVRHARNKLRSAVLCTSRTGGRDND